VGNLPAVQTQTDGSLTRLWLGSTRLISRRWLWTQSSGRKEGWIGTRRPSRRSVKEDDATALLRARTDQWHQTQQLSDDQLAELIRRDRIDILADRVGYMADNRLLVFAGKPAPIQVTAWGEPTGAGLKAMDYLLGSRVLMPEADRGLFAGVHH
jgi:hypothetical protein